MGPHFPPILSVLIIFTIIITSHSPLSIGSSPPLPPARQDRPNSISPVPSSLSEFTSPPPPHRRHSPLPSSLSDFTPPSRQRSRGPGGRADHHRQIKKSPRHNFNLGKKIGLLFIGVAAILQVAVAGFLVFKGWRIAKMKDRGNDRST
ncbi:uncharacterized protein LOC131250711 [Magnolia sinica]|uniref:uncharacterized protein LOC131250711 n=1 Tax=Magnolia sinica TaxID=86752 RepID=UPI002659C771|nr:uncharacterized protein LOC131250711 [Magnolia sinica]